MIWGSMISSDASTSCTVSCLDMPSLDICSSDSQSMYGSSSGYHCCSNVFYCGKNFLECGLVLLCPLKYQNNGIFTSIMVEGE